MPPLAALAAWNGAVTALYDEPLAEPRPHRVQGGRPRFLRLGRRLVCGSSLGGAGTRTPAPENSVWKKCPSSGPGIWNRRQYCWGKRGIASLKKEIRRFQEQQEPPGRPVPEQADLEDFVRYMGLGELLDRAWQARDHCYVIWTVKRSMKARCPECGAEITQPKFWYGGNYLDATRSRTMARQSGSW